MRRFGLYDENSELLVLAWDGVLCSYSDDTRLDERLAAQLDKKSRDDGVVLVAAVVPLEFTLGMGVRMPNRLLFVSLFVDLGCSYNGAPLVSSCSFLALDELPLRAIGVE